MSGPGLRPCPMRRRNRLVGPLDLRGTAHNGAGGQRRTRPTIDAGVGRSGTGDPATWSMEERWAFLELKVYDGLAGSGPKRPTVYWEITLPEVRFDHRHGSSDCVVLSKPAFRRARADPKSRALSRKAKRFVGLRKN